MKHILTVLTIVLLTACIQNDVPYPVIKGEVLALEVHGQQSSTIDTKNRTVSVVLGEEVDIKAAKITKFRITSDATSTLDISKAIDLSKKVDFEIITYQTYQWSIETTQAVERYMKVENQIGSARIDLQAKTVLISVLETQPLDQIKVMEFKLGPTSAVYSPDPMQLTDFTNPVTVDVAYHSQSEQWSITIVQSDLSVITQQADPWGGFANLYGSIMEGIEGEPMFEYRAADSQEWISVAATISGTMISGKATPLQGQTKYIYRAKVGEVVGQEVEFTTEATPLIPNMGFNDWAIKGKTWFPNSEPANIFWATGNEGVTATIAGSKDSNTFPTDDAVQGKAACITTIEAPLVDLAAGSLFTGTFTLNALKPLDSPKFSREYTGRPTSFSFWYKYDPKVVNVAKKRPELLGTTDKCDIYIYLGDWEGVLKSSQLKGEATEGIIAIGRFNTDRKVDVYTKQSVEMVYYDKVRRPTKIVLVASSSILGQDYIGGVGSTMWLDELEFSFD